MMPDVTIIGGGPAGSSAAIRLARTGRRVRLYEKSHFPRPKLCGGFLSPETLADLEDLEILEALRQTAIPLHRSVIGLRQGELIESRLPSEALSISRSVIDHLLLNQARRSGVDVHEGEDGYAHVDESPIRVIAAGRMDTLRDAKPSASPYFGIQALFRGVYQVSDQVELDLIKSGYVGLARQMDGVNVCALTTQRELERRGPSLDRVLSHFMEENCVLKNHLKNAKRVSPWMAVGPVLLGIRQLATGNRFYMGDAACVVDPFVGEGMAMGIYSSSLLVKALDQAEAPPAKTYAALWKQAFLPALRWNAAMRFLYRLPVFRDSFFKMLQGFPQGMQWITELTRYRRVIES